MPSDITTERLLAAVTWEWQDVEDLMEALIPTVASGKALRKYQVAAKTNKGNSSRPQLTEYEQIQSGARQIVNDRIGAQIGGGRIEKRIVEGRRQIRFCERREAADSRGACRTCNRPFPKATADQPQLLLPAPPRPKPQKVVYPAFPQWDRQTPRETGGSSG